MADLNIVTAPLQLRPSMSVQDEIAVKVLRDQLDSKKALVAQLIEQTAEMPPQVYNSHGKIVSGPSGSSIDLHG